MVHSYVESDARLSIKQNSPGFTIEHQPTIAQKKKKQTV